MNYFVEKYGFDLCVYIDKIMLIEIINIFRLFLDLIGLDLIGLDLIGLDLIGLDWIYIGTICFDKILFYYKQM